MRCGEPTVSYLNGPKAVSCRFEEFDDVSGTLPYKYTQRVIARNRERERRLTNSAVGLADMENAIVISSCDVLFLITFLRLGVNSSRGRWRNMLRILCEIYHVKTGLSLYYLFYFILYA